MWLRWEAEWDLWGQRVGAQAGGGKRQRGVGGGGGGLQAGHKMG